MLLKNVTNRPLNERHANSLAEEMGAGRWKTNGEPIIRGTDGRIIDGQHRLEAVIRSGRKIKFLVVEGVSNDVFDTIDLGRKRSAADTLAISGEADAKPLASSLQLFGKYMFESMRNRSFTLSPQQIEMLLENNRDITLSVKAMKEKEEALGRKAPIPFSALVFCHYVFSKRDAKLADKFIDQLITGAIPDPESPVLLLRESLKNRKGSGSRLATEYVLALCIKAFNCMVLGEKAEVLRFGPKERFPQVIAQEAK